MRNVFERSANRSNGNNVAYCNAGGNLNNNNANNGNYCAPDCVPSTGIRGLPEESPPATQRKEPPSRPERGEPLCGGRAPGPRAGGASGLPTITEEDVIGYDALMESARRCLAGVTWKGGVAWFSLHMAEQVSTLCEELHAGTYRQRRAREFEVTHPKRRIISAMAFRDRVVQRSYNDNVIYPLMSRSWIYDNYACQTGKGTDFARARMRCHLERHLREHGEVGGVLQVDVRGYYDHMRHDVVDARFAARLPPWAAEFAREALAWQYGGDVGYRPGSQMVQIAGIDYLSPLDHAVKERMGIRGYGRYMDDLLLVHEDVGHLERCLAEVTARLAAVGMEPHPSKTRIRPISEPFPFLGFDYRVRDGCVRMLVRPEKVKDQRRHLRSLARLVSKGRMSEADYLQALGCILEHDGKGDSPELVCRMRDYGEMLLRGALRDRN